MKTVIYEILYDRLPKELVDIIKDYYNDLQRNTLLDSFCSRFTNYEIWQSVAWDGHPVYHSKKTFRDGYTAQRITVHMSFYPYQKNYHTRARIAYQIEKRLIIGPEATNSWSRNVLIGTFPHAMNKRNGLIFDLMHYEKSEIISHCFDNNINCLKVISYLNTINFNIKVTNNPFEIFINSKL